MWIDSARGQLAAWLLLALGLTYSAWAMLRNRRGCRHCYPHVHADGTIHNHPHNHDGTHLHPHDAAGRRAAPWILFIVFLLGPCEALIPLMMAAKLLDGGSILVTLIVVFGASTLAAMLIVVALGYVGLRAAGSRLAWLQHHLDVLAGGAIAASGAAVLFLGL